jgi:hypothetical protein
MATQVIPETPQRKTEKRKAVRPVQLDFSNLTEAPKNTRFAAENGEESTSDLPQCPPQRLSYDKSSEPILKLRSVERGATITLGSKWIQLSKEGCFALKNIAIVDEKLSNEDCDQILRLQDKIYAVY